MTGVTTTSAEFSLPVRVYYEDTDSGGVVYYANYLKFMERARTEYLRLVGFELDQLHEQDNLQFVVRSIALDFIEAVRFNALLSVTARVVESGRASLVFDQRVMISGRVMCRGTVRLACVSTETFRPARIPAAIIDRVKSSP